MRIGVLFSGGKDSLYAAYLASKSKRNELACLIAMISENKDSYMFHTVNIELVDLQAKAIDLPIIKAKTKGEKERELVDLKKAIERAVKEHKIDAVVTGAIASTYQASRVQKICDELHIKCLNPLWQKDQLELLDEMMGSGIRFIVAGIAAYPLDEKWLGQEIDKQHIKKLKELQEKIKINPAGEGGEFESFVIDSPMHKKKIEIIEAEKKYSNHAGTFKIKKAKLVEK